MNNKPERTELELLYKDRKYTLEEIAELERLLELERQDLISIDQRIAIELKNTFVPSGI